MRHRQASRRPVLALALALVLCGSLAACQTPAERREADGAAASTQATPTESVAEVVVAPVDGAVDVAPDAPVTVTVSRGRIGAVELVGPAGVVAGVLGPSGATWTSNGPLALASSYTLDATAVDPYGLEVTARATFTTLAPAEEDTVDVSMAPLEGETVGVGMPVVLYLSDPVEDAYRASIEAHVSVTSIPSVPGAWHWINAEELHWRPQELWPAGSTVSVDVDIEGIRAGAAMWGGKPLNERPLRTFSITERAVTSVVDLAARNLMVFQDGVVLKTIPITAGKPGWETRNGVKVILEKHRDIVMDGDSVGIDPGDPEYYRLDVEYALRVTWSGEFLHSAPWSQGAQGEDLVSHGCVGMAEADAAWLFDLTTRGDIVTVTGSPRPLEKGNGYTDWNYTWDEWLAGSAVPPTTPPPA